MPVWGLGCRFQLAASPFLRFIQVCSVVDKWIAQWKQIQQHSHAWVMSSRSLYVAAKLLFKQDLEPTKSGKSVRFFGANVLFECLSQPVIIVWDSVLSVCANWSHFAFRTLNHLKLRFRGFRVECLNCSGFEDLFFLGVQNSDFMLEGAEFTLQALSKLNGWSPTA